MEKVKMRKTRKCRFSEINGNENHTIEKEKKKKQITEKIHHKNCKQNSTAADGVETFKGLLRNRLT